MLKKGKKLNTPQKLILLFWAIWSTLVATSDTVNLLQKMGLSPKFDILSSHNINLVTQSLAHYHVSNPLITQIIFFIIVGLAWVVAVFCWRGLSTLNFAYQAFCAIFALDAFFFLSDEFFFQYNLEHGHMERLGFKLLSFLVFLSLEKVSSNKKTSH